MPPAGAGGHPMVSVERAAVDGNVVEDLMRALRAWAEAEPSVEAVALVGSHARGDARPDSDVDLIVLSAEPARLLHDRDWVTRFGPVQSASLEDWGRVTSLRVRYEDGLELEFGIAAPEWATHPDVGTRRVVSDGLRVLWDPRGLLDPFL